MISLDEYASYFDNIDPLDPYKKWITGQDVRKESTARSRANVVSERVQAAFIVSDPVDWSRDIQVNHIPPLLFKLNMFINKSDWCFFFVSQVLCDILRTGGLPGKEIGPQPQLYFANDDLDYQVMVIPISIYVEFII